VSLSGETSKRSMFLMHGCVVVWGFTAVLGKMITLPALPLVAWRMGLTAVFLFLIARAWRTLGVLSLKSFVKMALIGVLIALHWLAFYGSVKLANASIGVMCMALAPIFTAVFEPVVAKAKFSKRNFLLSLSVLPGMLLLVGGVSEKHYVGMIIGVLSALLAAVFSLLNKQLVANIDALTLSFVEISIGGVFIWLVLLFSTGGAINMPNSNDWPLLIVFALFCTALPFALSNVALKSITAFSAQFAINLEPVYGIIFAACLLGETKQLTVQFYFGAAVILAAVFAQALMTHFPVSPSGETILAVPPSGETILAVPPSGETIFTVSPSGETILTVSPSGETHPGKTGSI
jgi:drug/metabolite transporter (DMT)-like permease